MNVCSGQEILQRVKIGVVSDLIKCTVEAVVWVLVMRRASNVQVPHQSNVLIVINQLVWSVDNVSVSQDTLVMSDLMVAAKPQRQP